MLRWRKPEGNDAAEAAPIGADNLNVEVRVEQVNASQVDNYDVYNWTDENDIALRNPNDIDLTAFDEEDVLQNDNHDGCDYARR